MNWRVALCMWAVSAVCSASAQTDPEAPSVPANLAGTAVSSTAVVVYWTQSEDNVGVTGYDIHRDGAFLLTHTDNTFTDTGLEPGGSHSYQVAARDALENLSALCSAVTVATDATENPRLIRPGNLSYQGAFRLPDDDNNNYAYGGTSIGFNPSNNSLFVRGHDWYQLVGEVSIPTPVDTSDPAGLPVASVVQNQTDITEGHLNDVGEGGSSMDGCKVGGMLVYGDWLIGTSYVYYDAGGNAHRSHFFTGMDFPVTGDFHGMFRVGSMNPGFVAGYMAHIPPDWQAELGGPVLTGLDGVPIVSRTSYGPTVSAFDPARLGVDNPVSATLLVGYTYQHATLGTWGNSSEINPQFNQASGASGLVFPFGSDSVLFFGSTGIGIPHYGAGTSDPELHLQPVPGTNGQVVYVYDPTSSAKGCHAYPYVAYVWAYRAQDLARAADGSLQPWQVVPYQTWQLDLPFGPDGSDRLAGAAYDPATQRLFISQYNAYHSSAIIHVYEIINLPPSNAAPVITPIGDRNVPAGEQLQFTVQGTDADGDQLQFSATGE